MKLFCATLMVLILYGSGQAAMTEDTLSFAPFGTIHMYQATEKPDHLVLFISGDGGWNLGVVEMARKLAQTHALVAGIDITHYFKESGSLAGKCSYTAAHLESLSQSLQARYAFKSYTLPILVGYSSGATLVYATLAQSPPNTFLGGVSLGFCPDLLLPKPMCKGDGKLTWTMDTKIKNTYIFKPAELVAPWIALQGDTDQVCDPAVTKEFVGKVGNGRVIMLPGVGHGYSAPKNWLPQFKAAFQQILDDDAAVRKQPKAILPVSLGDLPLVELPVTDKGVGYFAVILTGDGGWAGIDKSLGEAMNRENIPVVGLNCLQYFWAPKTPEQSAADLARIIQYYSQAWGQNNVVLIGYSLGADVLPFMINRLPEAVKSNVVASVLLGAEAHVEFQVRVADWLGSSKTDAALPVIPEVKNLAGRHLACIYGADEKETSICPDLDQNFFKVVQMPGGHHFGGDYQKLARIILDHVKTAKIP